jgi:hypothetical protein
MDPDAIDEPRVPRLLADPLLPSAAEVELHDITHLPFRSWCQCCVKGKANNVHHHKQRRDHDIPHVYADYCFLDCEKDAETLVVQIMKDKDTGMIFAHAVPRKGLVHIHGAEDMIKDLDKLGHKKIFLICDNELAMKALQTEVQARRGEMTILESSPFGESQSNGVAERAVQTISSHVRVMRLALKNRAGIAFSSQQPVMTWLVEAAADLVSKNHVEVNGKTGYEGPKGKKSLKAQCEFGEKVLYRSGKLDPQHKLEPRWSGGIYLGMSWRTGAMHVSAGGEGVIQAHGIRRVPMDTRWSAELLHKVVGVCHGGQNLSKKVKWKRHAFHT